MRHRLEWPMVNATQLRSLPGRRDRRSADSGERAHLRSIEAIEPADPIESIERWLTCLPSC
ncbi:MAG: hypothetical protein HRT86_07455 [Ilumatobacteraceae bacterium]|nr:hypothetical protein [Ilumatobacteraceae bacterium]